MIAAIIFLNSRGDIILSRPFRDNVNIRSLGEAFRTQIIATKQADRAPVKTLGSVSFLHMRHENLYVVATTKQNVNAALVFTFLSKMLQIFRAYFGTVNEDSVKENFVLIHELIDEITDFGYPQNTEVDALKLYITSQGLNPELLNKPRETGMISTQVTGTIGWRPPNLKYRKNEVFIDVVEDVNLLMSQQGNVLHRDVSGTVVMKSFLTGMPDCKFGLNDKSMLERERHHKKKVQQEIDLEDVTFHQCVKLGKFDTDRTISFIPPDGEFTLMKYRSTDNVSPPFRIISPVVRELGKTRLEIDFKIKAEFSSRLFGTSVVVSVPTPKNTASCKISTGTGKAKYEAAKHAILWRIRRFPGGSEFSFSAEIQLISTTQAYQAWARPPISLQFQVPMLAASGLHVRFLRVNEPKFSYQAVKWVRYITKAGQYECRI
eukprot:TRINITY_DN77400_c0_g1_i1.p1 TRINITY_DN77400_c0_g1~~TRINITY_DN77400_c0_g1_i1.p1  ORF type:complete len:433 (+),score=46.20 TRINITY_DN77400_c0_g1_i1:96-1394(+)